MYEVVLVVLMALAVVGWMRLVDEVRRGEDPVLEADTRLAEDVRA